MDLPIKCGDQDLKQFFKHATKMLKSYRSTTAISELIEAISTHLENAMLDQIRKSHFMVDESCDVSTVEKLSICAHWLNNRKPEEYFLKLIPVDKTDAATIASVIKAFLDQNNLLATMITTSNRTGRSCCHEWSEDRDTDQAEMSFSHSNLHCRCHQLQLACVYAAKTIKVVSHAQSNILAIWKLFHYSSKKAAILCEIQAVLAHPLLKMLKPGDTQWLPHHNSVHTIRLSFFLSHGIEVHLMRKMANQAFSLAKLVKSYNFIATVSMLCDALDPVARLVFYFAGLNQLP